MGSAPKADRDTRRPAWVRIKCTLAGDGAHRLFLTVQGLEKRGRSWDMSSKNVCSNI